MSLVIPTDGWSSHEQVVGHIAPMSATIPASSGGRPTRRDSWVGPGMWRAETSLISRRAQWRTLLCRPGALRRPTGLRRAPTTVTRLISTTFHHRPRSDAAPSTAQPADDAGAEGNAEQGIPQSARQRELLAPPVLPHSPARARKA